MKPANRSVKKGDPELTRRVRAGRGVSVQPPESPQVFGGSVAGRPGCRYPLVRDLLAGILGETPNSKGRPSDHAVHERTGIRLQDVSRLRKGEIPLTKTHVDRLVECYPHRTAEIRLAAGQRVTAARPAPPPVSGDLWSAVRIFQERRVSAQGQTWVELARNEIAALDQIADECLASLEPLSRLASAADYVAVARAAVAALPDLGCLFPAANSVHEATLGRLRAAGEALRAESFARIAEAADSARVKEGRELLAIHAAAKALVRRADIQPKDLHKLPAWRAIVTAVCGHLVRVEPIARERVCRELAKCPQSNQLADELRGAAAQVRHISFPCREYVDDPVRFCHEVLGFRPWSRQESILLAIRDNKRVVIRSGHKTGKSRILSAAAIWWYCAHAEGKVMLSNATGKQLSGINWPEVARLVRKSGVCVACRDAERVDGTRQQAPCPHSQVVDGELHATYLGGLIAPDLEREIKGATAQNVEGLAGFSGEQLLILVDEASALSQEVFEAWSGNVAAKGAKMVMAGNPTKNAGPFFDAFGRNSQKWHGIHVSSLEAAAEDVPGLASREWCEMIEEEDPRGQESAFYQIRVAGNFAKSDTAAIFPLDLILSATDEVEWGEMPFEGTLVIGLDPAGPSGLGDESVFAVGRLTLESRGKVEHLRAGKGWDDDAHVAILDDLVTTYRQQGEYRVVVGVDADGVGAKVRRAFDGYAESHRGVQIVPVFFGGDARNRNVYDKCGDEAYALVSEWLRTGGKIPRHPKLEQELEAMTWTAVVRRNAAGREITVQSATRKKDFRKIYHRSPDRLEALRVWCWTASVVDLLLVGDRAPRPVSEAERRAADDRRREAESAEHAAQQVGVRGRGAAGVGYRVGTPGGVHRVGTRG